MLWERHKDVAVLSLLSLLMISISSALDLDMQQPIRSKQMFYHIFIYFYFKIIANSKAINSIESSPITGQFL